MMRRSELLAVLVNLAILAALWETPMGLPGVTRMHCVEARFELRAALCTPRPLTKKSGGGYAVGEVFRAGAGAA